MCGVQYRYRTHWEALILKEGHRGEIILESRAHRLFRTAVSDCHRGVMQLVRTDDTTDSNGLYPLNVLEKTLIIFLLGFGCLTELILLAPQLAQLIYHAQNSLPRN